MRRFPILMAINALNRKLKTRGFCGVLAVALSLFGGSMVVMAQCMPLTLSQCGIPMNPCTVGVCISGSDYCTIGEEQHENNYSRITYPPV